MTSSCPSGPPKDSTSSASRRPAGAGSVDGAAPPLLRMASDGSSSGRWPAGVMSTVARATVVLLSPGPDGCSSRADGVEAPVYPHDLGPTGREPARQQGTHG